MSLEPDTNGKVVLKTTLGDLEIELWGKETPLACKNFIQLCLEGYYNGCIFHRLVKSFIAQTGDPSGTGTGGESIYENNKEKSFKDEIHSRLRFNRRGLVGMASNEKDSNKSQFFITLDKTEELTRKNTLFGRVVGDSLFNILQINEMEVDENEKPLFPPKIISTKVLMNPFPDINPRENKKQQPTQSQQLSTQNKSKKKKNTTKNLGLLSFGDEEDQIEDNKPTPIQHSTQKNKPPPPTTTTINELIEKPKETKEIKEIPLEIKETTVKINLNDGDMNVDIKKEEENILSFSEKMRNQILEREKKREREEGIKTGSEIEIKEKELLGEPKVKKVKVVGSLSFKTVQNSNPTDYKPSIKSKKGTDTNILAKLNKFKSNLQKTDETNNNKVDSNENNNENDNEGSWKYHKLEFKKTDVDHRNDHYVIHDHNTSSNTSNDNHSKNNYNNNNRNNKNSNYYNKSRK